MKLLLSVIVTAAALCSGCDSLGVINRQPSVSGLGGAGGSAGAHGTSSQGGAVGLPCDVQAIVVKYCADCHGSSPSGGAPRSLMTYVELTRKDLMNPSVSEAQEALVRMQSTSSPMPPSPTAGPTSAEISTFQSWIANSYPTGTCGIPAAGGSSGNGNGGNGSGNGGSSGGGGAGGSSSGGTTPPTGLPCDVQAVFANNCASCHGSTPSGGAPRSLVTYADLTMLDPASTSKTEAQVALDRMQSSVAPMPPSPSAPLSASDIATIQKWVSSGYAKGTCGQSAGGSGGGAGGAGGSGRGGSSTPGSGGNGGSSGDAGVANGLPCEIQSVVTNHCVSCHGSSPSGGAPRALFTYANLTMADPANPGMTEAQVALQRMQNTAAPMPPAPDAPVSSSEISAWQSWVNAGYPKGSCGATGGSGGSAGGTGGSGAGGAAGSSGTRDAGVPGGVLPCDVQTLLANKCDSCHGSTPSGGAPRSLVTYAHLTAADVANPSMTEAQVALQRMQSTASPMPPSPATPATSAEITALQNWINSGYASGPGCTGDAGTVGPDPLNAAPTCTSKTNWTGGNRESPLMNPGQACITCHASSGEAPKFVIAGTLYPTGHEPNNCNGVNGTNGAHVVVTGNNGTSVTLTPNAAGNFYSSTSLPGPYKAKVVDSAGKERVMVATAPNGDCNSCHTPSGANGAPGRITMP